MQSKPPLNLLAIVAVLGLVQMTMAAASKGNTEDGKKIYAESCQSCHGTTGKGDGDMAAYLTPPPANLATKATQSNTDAQLPKIILEGRPGRAMASTTTATAPWWRARRCRG